ncbi:TetR/AcrR family transcriptional regulator [Bowmanella pacifica]|uniref:Transcriptional regulator n=1 Tax=Bowmanella pacifica TaxID=502051 RepID=A0A917YRJ6_9ALTE|nr:TetR/AcrR family transcriptional regulator [Bowmanella pacifica]GGO64949.1 transcriptional regulator [Bowmanella pacifica]
MKTKYQDTRQHLLDTGRIILAEQGFSSVGLSALLQQAGVPKGSFYHYFKSKEHYGQVLLEDYFSTYMQDMEALLGQSQISAKQRLLNYFAQWLQRFTPAQGRCDCLVVKLSAEVADLSEAMRLTLKAGTEQVMGRLMACIEEAIREGSLPEQDVRALASNLYQLWLGASLLTKLSRDDEQVKQAMQLTCKLLVA